MLFYVVAIRLPILFLLIATTLEGSRTSHFPIRVTIIMAPPSTSTSVQASDIPVSIISYIHQFSQLLICKACLPYAEELKTEGNDHYRAGSWKEALAAYRSGLGGLPARIKDKRQEDMQATDAGSAQTPVDDEKEDQPDSQLTDAGENVGEHDTETGPWEKEYSKTRAALHANIAACYVKLVSVRSHRMPS
jgi:hypothetical protein